METIATILHADLDAFYAPVEQLLEPSCAANLLLSAVESLTDERAVGRLDDLTRRGTADTFTVKQR